jgi:NADH:ubiquinone oxidoreductase subunit F (NADH-binding)
MEIQLLEWARRHASGATDGNAVSDLIAGLGDKDVAERRGLPPAAVIGLRGFYDQVDHGVHVCDGTACHFAGGPQLAARVRSDAPVGEVRCLGHCYDAPAIRVGDAVFARRDRALIAPWLEEGADRPPRAGPRNVIPRRSFSMPPVVLRSVLTPHHDGFDPAEPGPAALSAAYDLPDGDAILRALEATGLRGRGGAAYPTAAKWRATRDTSAPARFVVANGDEGDPGSFVDRLLLEEAPHDILSGMVACARAIGATHGIVYIRAECPRAQAVMRAAVARARADGYLGIGFDVTVVSGAGSYVCGEETALLRSIEGLRGEPHPKPPFPAQSGLFGLPTVVQNVETLVAVPWIARTGRGAGTKALSLSGAIRTPGVVEFPLGTRLRTVLEDAGGGVPPGRKWRMALIGGPMGRVVPVANFDTPLSFDALPGMGHGGIVVLDETVTPWALAQHLFHFAQAESCGSCTPCRVGTAQLASRANRAELERLCDTLEMGSLCGFGMGVPRPLRDLLEHYGEAVFHADR